jgi:hypothetical protein
MATTTPNYGWSVPTSTDYVAQGAVAMETLGDSVDATLFTALGGNYPGLRLVKKQTVGTSAGTVVVTSAFSAAYENYRIIYTGGTASSTLPISVQLSGAVTNYNYVGTAQQFGNSTVIPLVGGPGAQWDNMGRAATQGNHLNFDLFSPFVTSTTTFRSNCVDYSSGGFIISTGGVQTGTISHTGFSFTSAALMTGGTVYVYGYGAS